MRVPLRAHPFVNRAFLVAASPFSAIAIESNDQRQGGPAEEPLPDGEDEDAAVAG